MKKIFPFIIALLVLATARPALAVTPSSGSVWENFTAETDMTVNYANGFYVISYDAGHTCTGADIADAGRAESVYYPGTQPAGSTFLDLQLAGRTMGGGANEPLVDPMADLYLCGLFYSGGWQADNPTPFHYIYGGGGGGGGPTGVAGLIESASTTFANDLGGISLVNVEDQLKSQMLLVAGSALGFTRIILPYILVVAIIFGIVYFIYRGFIFFRH